MLITFDVTSLCTSRCSSRSNGWPSSTTLVLRLSPSMTADAKCRPPDCRETRNSSTGERRHIRLATSSPAARGRARRSAHTAAMPSTTPASFRITAIGYASWLTFRNAK